MIRPEFHSSMNSRLARALPALRGYYDLGNHQRVRRLEGPSGSKGTGALVVIVPLAFAKSGIALSCCCSRWRQ